MVLSLIDVAKEKVNRKEFKPNLTFTVKVWKEEQLNRWIYRMLRVFELIDSRCKKGINAAKKLSCLA